MALSESARRIIDQGSRKIRVSRSGMFQQLTFTVKKTRLGNIEYNELFTDRIIDVSELTRLTNELGLPVEAKNGRAFPVGMSASDFKV